MGSNGTARPGEAPVVVMPPGHDLDGKIPDLDAVIRKAFYEVLSSTGNAALACRVTGIASRTFSRWRARGRQDTEGKYFSFAGFIDRALAEWERRQIAVIVDAAQDWTSEEEWAEQWTNAAGKTSSKVVKKRIRKKGDWRAALVLLERRFRARWGPKSDIKIEGRLDMVDVLTQLRDEAEKADGERSRKLLTGGPGSSSDVQKD